MGGLRTGSVNHDASEGYKVEEVEGPPFSISQGDKMKLPPANNFAEGQRYIYGLLASAGGMFCGAASGLMVALLMWGGWSPPSSIRSLPSSAGRSAPSF
jgi:hypothetical protein